MLYLLFQLKISEANLVFKKLVWQSVKFEEFVNRSLWSRQ